MWITFIMDGYTLWTFKTETSIHCHYKAWKSHDQGRTGNRESRDFSRLAGIVFRACEGQSDSYTASS